MACCELFLRGTPARKLVRRDTEALSLGRINIPSYTDGQIFGTISTQKQAISKIKHDCGVHRLFLSGMPRIVFDSQELL
ncbi:unnamed protein product [Timema podura]|uniref:Uncharacterized protein n=1 Tax=Timema podura TaxID=61482 RepID=A0ABN7P2X4_TIMPD|nr:unnamed protein product [Timema podura]